VRAKIGETSRRPDLLGPLMPVVMRLGKVRPAQQPLDARAKIGHLAD
jgi:hypothetical protein